MPRGVDKLVMKTLTSSILFWLLFTHVFASELILGSVDYGKKWINLASNEKSSKEMLISLLCQTTYGKKVVKAAQQKAAMRGKSLIDLIVVGNGSVTDTTLIRRFAKSDPEIVEYENRSEVYLNSDLSIKNAILDLAHELTHFTRREPFNPYLDSFNFISFLRATIEERGGEAEAFIAECKVMRQLFAGKVFNESKCPQIIDVATGKFSLKLTKQRFYQVGAQYGQFWEEAAKLGVTRAEVPEVSDGQAIFISSAYGLPYPLATIREYQSMMRRVCHNDERRLGYMKEKLGRSPASVTVKKSYKQMERSFFKRCGNIEP